MMLDELGLVIEHVEMAGGPRHEQLDHALGLRWVVTHPGLLGRRGLLAQQGRQGDPPETATGAPEKVPPIEKRSTRVVVMWEC